MFSANHRQPKRKASRHLTMRLLVCVNYLDRILFPQPGWVQLIELIWNRWKSSGGKFGRELNV
jgi:hypothetical protein